MFKTVIKLIWHMCAVIGVVSIIAGSYMGLKIIKDHNLTVRRASLLVAGKLGISNKVIRTLLEPKQRYKDYRFQGEFKTSHPRILFKDQSYIERIRNRYLTDSVYKNKTDKSLNNISAWVCKKDFKSGSKAIRSLLKGGVSLPENQEDFGSGLHKAINYDLLYDHPDWTTKQRDLIEKQLHKSLNHALRFLDGDSTSLWHGRFQLACSSWVAAAVLNPEKTQNREFQRRAQAHFIEAINAISITQGWPEGYNYWINSRAYPFVLACLAHLNSVNAPKLNSKIKTAIEDVGLWTIYGTEPGGRFVPFGDAGPRNDLKDESQRIIDLIYLGTGNPVFKYYSYYIEFLHKGQGYYRGYRWTKSIFEGLPELGFYQRGVAIEDLSFLNKHFENTHLFGPGLFEQAFIRSGWSKHDTFISYRAGGVFTHHGHYQAGHFTLFKEEPLALSSGTYGNFFSPHRLNYYIRTISSNSILIIDPKETITPNRFFKTNVNAGGQRIIIPTGSAVQSIEEWQDNLKEGKKFEAGNINVFDNTNPDYVYIKSDLTPAYGKKAARVTRELVYLNSEDMLIIHDIVESSKAHYLKKWLLHSNYKPYSETEALLKGKSGNGILETFDNNLEITGNKQNLAIAIILPEKPIVRKIGGPDYKYYVETDGDDRELNGENMIQGANESPWFDSGLWRMEIFSPDKKAQTEFLVILKPLQTGQNYHPTNFSIHRDKNRTELSIGKQSLFFPNNRNQPFRIEKKRL